MLFDEIIVIVLKGVVISNQILITLIIAVSEKPAHEDDWQDEAEGYVEPKDWLDVDQWHVVRKERPLDRVDRIAAE